ncbi:hypothetical protein RHSIM_Rhsim09G0181600 [Rhododendron simsii]|uniref:Uncharacterized protein n=1 Tax=Rhododendron simsii TaxID=118357 RepID=A0A834GL80_RHOSS|nr:hypothetical protein RHSIM_Rhsim09G0181600 [Rhododendron simsii]
MSSSTSSSRPLKIGIIGFGTFGQFLSKTMIKQGHTITATSRSDHSHLCSHLGISFYREIDGFLEAENDVVVLSTSILSLSEVVKSIPFPRLKPPTLIVDVLSVKEHPKQVLLQGCKMLEMSCEEHDKLAARSQFLTHTIARTLSEMAIESTPIDTKNFETLVKLKESTMRNSFDLFSGLFIHNRFAKQELKNLEVALEKVKQKLQDRMNEELDLSGNIGKQTPKVDNVESGGLKSLLDEDFSTREDLLDRVRNVALKEGYVTVIKRSKAGRYVIIGCDRGGKFRCTVPLDEMKKISATRLINCPFEVWGKKKVGECWKVVIKNASHNHELSSEISGHPYCRRFSQEEMLSIKQMTLAGIPPRQILTSLRKSNPNCKAIARTVYHAKANITKEVLAGRTMIQALFEELGQGEFSFDVEREDWETFLLTWTNLIESPDESSFNEAWHLIEVQYKEKEYVLNYIKNIWLPFKERFVNAWTGKHPHFGNRVTSRVEGAHAMLKKYLTVSTGNLREELVTHVSVYALGELFKQCELAKTDYVLGSCTGNFSRTMGLPCAHMMRNKKDGILQLGDIHPQWRIDKRSFTNMDGGAHQTGSEIECLLKNFHEKYKNMPLVQKEESLKQIALLVDAEIPLTLEPNIQPHKGRPLGSKKRKGDSSITRHPSAFEIAEKTRKCGACHRVGHNRRTCPGNGESNSHSPHFVVANQDFTLNMLETPWEVGLLTGVLLDFADLCRLIFPSLVIGG